MMIYVGNRHTLIEKHQKRHPGAVIVDVTSKAADDFVQFSPFFPHGDIPIPFTDPVETAMSVEGIWQGLKVFETADIDPACFANDTMQRLKRTVRKYGKTLGHRKGTQGSELLGYLEARILIYLPIYRWMLEHKTPHLVAQLQQKAATADLVLLDYETNCSVLDRSAPLSHAYLLKTYLEGNYPQHTLADL